MEETWTILKVLRWTTGYFESKGIEQPRADAEVLLAHALRMERIQLYLRFDQPLTAAELATYRELVRRRALREPSQYITGTQEFWSLEFEVNRSVLIPRPETEMLVERAASHIGKNAPHILDLGTGSGIIAVSIARECPSVFVTATDKCWEALRVAHRNALKHGVENRIAFAVSDLFSGFSSLRPTWDLIVSNPPYIGDEEFQTLTPEVARHEPREALRGHGPEGLNIIRQIIDEAPLHLKPGGKLLMEIGHLQWRSLEQHLLQLGYSQKQFQFIRDYSGILRVLDLTPGNR